VNDVLARLTASGRRSKVTPPPHSFLPPRTATANIPARVWRAMGTGRGAETLVIQSHPGQVSQARHPALVTQARQGSSSRPTLCSYRGRTRGPCRRACVGGRAARHGTGATSAPRLQLAAHARVPSAPAMRTVPASTAESAARTPPPRRTSASGPPQAPTPAPSNAHARDSTQIAALPLLQFLSHDLPLRWHRPAALASPAQVRRGETPPAMATRSAPSCSARRCDHARRPPLFGHAWRAPWELRSRRTRRACKTGFPLRHAVPQRPLRGSQCDAVEPWRSQATRAVAPTSRRESGSPTVPAWVQRPADQMQRRK
jgi:hypothetical protein